MAEDASTESGTFETPADAGEGGQGVFRLWMSAIDLADRTEKDWRKRGLSASKRYRDEEERRGARFNILYSSVQTQAPAVYNSTPKPDVRRRFNDKDVAGKLAAQAFERSLSHCIDEYDFDCPMSATVFDSLLVGRGVGMVVYDPTLDEQGNVVYETTRYEHVQWDDFRRGPGKAWQDVPWVAVRYRITRDEAIALNPKKGPTVGLDHIEQGTGNEKEDVPDVFKRLTVWKIWDKSKRQVVFIAPSFKEGPFAVEDDQLGLKDFFPFPRPVYDIEDSASLVPLVPYDMYRDQAEELDRVTKRIHSLVNVLRWRGIRPSQITEFDTLKDAEDGDLVPSESATSAIAAAQAKGLDDLVWLMPVDRLILVVRELVAQREAIKQVVFEISGLADIMRGETNPNETLGAQQIKAQWGSLRMQKRQREVQRFARDVMRIKAEIIGEHYSPETLQAITGIRLPTDQEKQVAQQQAQQMQMAQQPPPPELQDVLNTPTWAEVKQVMASDAMRSFRVDIETDSTIQADLTRAQQNMAQFVEGLGAFTQAMGPGIQSGEIPKDVATDILVAFARNFKLGRQAEDALERLGEESRTPKPPAPDPAALKAQADAQQAQADQQMKQQEMQANQQMEQQRLAMEQQKSQADIQAKAQMAQMDADAKMRQAEQELALKRDVAFAELELKREIALEELRLKHETAMQDMALKRDVADDKAEMQRETQSQMAEAD